MRPRENEEGMILVNVLMFVAIAGGPRAADDQPRGTRARPGPAHPGGGTRAGHRARRRAVGSGGIAPRCRAGTGGRSCRRALGASSRKAARRSRAAASTSRSPTPRDASTSIRCVRAKSPSTILFQTIGNEVGLKPEQVVAAVEYVRLRGPVTDLRPLRMAGIEPEIADRLEKLVTALPGTTTLNLNAADQEMLALLFRDPLIAQRLVAVRERQGFLTAEGPGRPECLAALGDVVPLEHLLGAHPGDDRRNEPAGRDSDPAAADLGRDSRSRARRALAQRRGAAGRAGADGGEKLKHDPEQRAAAVGVGDVDRAAMRDHDLAGEVEAHAGALGARGEEGQEYILRAGSRERRGRCPRLRSPSPRRHPTGAARSRGSSVACSRLRRRCCIRLISTCASRSGSASSARLSGATSRSSGTSGAFGREHPPELVGRRAAAANCCRLISGVVRHRAIGFDEIAEPLRAARQRLDRGACIGHARVGREIGIAEQIGGGRGERGHRRQRVEDLVRQHADEIGLRRHFDGIERALDRLDADRARALPEPLERRRADDHALRAPGDIEDQHFLALRAIVARRRAKVAP